MEKLHFQRVKEQLADRYSKDTLADLLVKHKCKRISKLLCAAYNHKVQFKNEVVEEVDKEVVGNGVLAAKRIYDQKRRPLGPGSWYYQLLEKESWDNYLKEVKSEGLEPTEAAQQIFKIDRREKRKN